MTNANNGIIERLFGIIPIPVLKNNELMNEMKNTTGRDRLKEKFGFWAKYMRGTNVTMTSMVIPIALGKPVSPALNSFAFLIRSGNVVMFPERL